MEGENTVGSVDWMEYEAVIEGWIGRQHDQVMVNVVRVDLCTFVLDSL